MKPTYHNRAVRSVPIFNSTLLPSRGYNRPGVRRVNPYLLILAVVISGTFGLTALRAESGKTAASRVFTNMPGFAIWVASVAAVLMLATFLGGLTWFDFLRARQYAGKVTFRITVVTYIVVGVAAIFGTFWVISPLYTPLYFFNWRILALSITILTVSADCFCGLLLINGIAHKHAKSGTLSSMSAGESMRELITMRSDLRRFLVSAALIVAGIMLTIGALRNALDAYNSVTYGDVIELTPTGILVFGAFFAGLLAVISIPAYIAWRASAQALRDSLYPLPHDGRPSRDWYRGRSDLETLLEMRIGTGQRFAALVGIASPIIIGIISAFIPTIHGG